MNLNPLIQVLISGFFTGLAFHPIGLGILAWFSFVPLIHVFNISHLKKRIDSGAKYIFFLNSSYGNTIKQLKKNIDIFNWLNSEQNKLYESKNIILYKLNSVSK